MSSKKYNVIFVLLDGARADRLDKSNDFINLIRKGTLFPQMIAGAPYTVASVHAMMSGMYGSKNGVDAYNNMFKFKDSCKPLAQYFKENGYYTRGGTFRLSLVPERGFDNLTEHENEHSDSFEEHTKIIDEIEGIDKPFFLYLHYADIHSSIVKNVYDKYTDFDDEYFDSFEDNSKAYDNLMNEAGIYTKNIYNYLESKNMLKDSIFVLTSDHGMGVGEKKGERAYGIFTYDYSIKSFSLFIQPEIFKKNNVISDLTRTIDIMPTLLDINSIPQDSDYMRMQGESLLPLVNTSVLSKMKSYFSFSNKGERIAYCETGGLYGPWPSPKAPNVKCVRTSKWKLIHNITPDTWELYNLALDPYEKDNIIGHNKNIENMLKSQLESINDSFKKN